MAGKAKTKLPGTDAEPPQLVLLRGQPVGRLILNRAPEEFRLVDIALLAGHRSRGIGTSLLQHLQAEAVAAGKPLRLTVLKGHRAARLYRRLGFVPTAETELHQELLWSAAPLQPRDSPPIPTGLYPPAQG